MGEKNDKQPYTGGQQQSTTIDGSCSSNLKRRNLTNGDGDGLRNQGTLFAQPFGRP